MKLYEPFQFLSTAECDQILEYGNPRRKREGTLIGKKNDQVRNNRIVWYKDPTHWKKWIAMFNTIENRIDWIMDPQISYYTPGEHYGWHTDQSVSNRTHQRYFTLTCELQTAPGARFELKDRTFPELQKGQAIIFPSVDEHRATTPETGERISFTIWAMAKNYHKH